MSFVKESFNEIHHKNLALHTLEFLVVSVQRNDWNACAIVDEQ